MPECTAIQPRVPAHHLDDHHAVVRLRGRVQAVDRLGRDRDGGVEAEGVVGRVQVVVDRLRNADDRKAVLGVEPRRDAERVLAADRDERVEPLVLEGREHLLDAALELVRVRARRAEDRAAAREDSGDVAAAERLDDPFDQPAPALAHAEHLPPTAERASRDRADDRIQPGAVASAREHPDSLRHHVSLGATKDAATSRCNWCEAVQRSMPGQTAGRSCPASPS